KTIGFVDDGLQSQAEDVVFGFLALLDLIPQLLNPCFDLGDLMLAPLEVALEGLFEQFGEFSRRTCFVCVALRRFQLLNRLMKRLELLHFLAGHRMRERTSKDPMAPVLAPAATDASQTH